MYISPVTLITLFQLSPATEVNIKTLLHVHSVTLHHSIQAVHFLDPPTLEVGPIDSLSLVRPFVRPSVRYKFFSATNHRISLIFCIKLAFNKTKKVTKPDF